MSDMSGESCHPGNRGDAAWVPQVRLETTVTGGAGQIVIRLLHKPDPSRGLPEHRPPRLLLLQIAGIGDLVLATPALDALRERFPNATIDLVTSPRAVGLLAGHPALNSIYGFDIGRFRNPLTLLIPAHFRGLMRALRPLRSARYDALLSLNNISTKRGAFTLGGLMYSTGAPLWVGRNTNRRAPWFDRALEESGSELVPEVISKLRTAALLGASDVERPLSLPLQPSALIKAEQLLEGSERWAAILPGANVAEKQWPAERFTEAALHLANRGYRIVTLGGPEDRHAAKVIDQLVTDQILHLEGELTLAEAAAVLARCRVALTNDTGPMHMAAAVGTPLVAIFCSINVARYQPWAAPNQVRVLTGNTESIDPHSPEGMRASVVGVSVEQVVGALGELIA